MTLLLHIIASARGELSHSHRAGQAAVLRLLAQHLALSVIERDLGRNPVAHPDARFVEACLEKWLRKFEHAAKWIGCSRGRGDRPQNRSSDEQANPS